MAVERPRPFLHNGQHPVSRENDFGQFEWPYRRNSLSMSHECRMPPQDRDCGGPKIRIAVAVCSRAKTWTSCDECFVHAATLDCGMPTWLSGLVAQRMGLLALSVMNPTSRINEAHQGACRMPTARRIPIAPMVIQNELQSMIRKGNHSDNSGRCK